MSRLIIIFLCLVSIVLIVSFLVWPKYQKFSDFQQKIKNKETEIGYIEKYFSNLKKLSQKLTEYESQLAKISPILPSDSSLTAISLIDFVQKASTQNGLVLKKIETPTVQPKPTIPATGSAQNQLSTKVKEIYFTFETSGSYSYLKNFLDTLERSVKIIEVENISFSIIEKEENPTFKLKIKTYSF